MPDCPPNPVPACYTYSVDSICSMRESVRFILGDNDSDATLFRYQDCAIDGAIRTALKMGMLRGCFLQPDGVTISPPILDPNRYALLVYKVVKMFMDPLPDSYRYKTRAVSESFGSWKNFINTLESNIYQLENGRMFSGWMNYYNWLCGMAGLPLGQVLTQLNVRQPIFGQQFSLDSFPLPIDEVIKF